MIAFIDERCSMLQNEIMKQTKERSENVGILEDELEADFPKLKFFWGVEMCLQVTYSLLCVVGSQVLLVYDK